MSCDAVVEPAVNVEILRMVVVVTDFDGKGGKK